MLTNFPLPLSIDFHSGSVWNTATTIALLCRRLPPHRDEAAALYLVKEKIGMRSLNTYFVTFQLCTLL